jgi:hypothetical protein
VKNRDIKGFKSLPPKKIENRTKKPTWLNEVNTTLSRSLRSFEFFFIREVIKSKNKMLSKVF